MQKYEQEYEAGHEVGGDYSGGKGGKGGADDEPFDDYGDEEVGGRRRQRLSRRMLEASDARVVVAA